MPSVDRSVSPATLGASGHSDLQRVSFSASARKRSGPERLATSKKVFRTARSTIPCQSSASGHRPSSSKHTRGQSRETGSLSTFSGSVEASAKCISMGPARRERVQDSVQVSFASVQQGIFHSGGPRAGSGNGTRSRSICLQHRKFPRFAFRGKAYQYRVFPFSLALSHRTFTKSVDAALGPLRLQGFRILNYIGDWLILAQSEQLAVRHWDVVLAQMKDLGLRLNAKKSVFFKYRGPLIRAWCGIRPQCRHVYLLLESSRSTVKRVRVGQSLNVKFFKKLLGLMAAASNVITLACCTWDPCSGGSGPQGFLRGATNFAWSRSRLCALDMWKKPWFLSQGPVLGAPCHRVMLTMDAFLTGWEAVMSGRSAQGLWEGPHLM